MKAHRMDQETVERLLVGSVVDPPPGPAALVRLLTAVRAAPRPAELGGEGVALQAFRAARGGGVAPVAVHAGRAARLAGRLSLKVALTSLAVAATGGVALAAATGTLPGPLQGPGGHTGSTTPATPVTPQPSSTGGPGQRSSPSATQPGRPTSSASLLALCRAYRAGAGDNPARALENPVFSELIGTAGGRGQVTGYCDHLLDDRNVRPNSGTPTADQPGTGPTPRPAARPERSPSPPAPPSTAGVRPTTPGNGPKSATNPDSH
jgi:hypothetical protein